MHSSHFGKTLGPFLSSFTGVTNGTNEGSVPFSVAQWFSKLNFKDLHNSESVQMEPNGPVGVHLVHSCMH